MFSIYVILEEFSNSYKIMKSVFNFVEERNHFFVSLPSAIAAQEMRFVLNAPI